MQIVMPRIAVPEYVELLVTTYYSAVLDWFSGQVYTNLIKRDAQHVLVQVHKIIDWTKLESACSGFHHDHGAGAPPIHSSVQLVRALLVGYLCNWSLRQLEWQIRFNLIVKWFVGYPVYADGPDHSTLERFEVWVAEHQHRTLFDEILRQIDQAMPEERESAQQRQVGDTYVQEANAAREQLVRLIRHASERMLKTVARADVAREALVRSQMDVTTLLGAPNEKREYYLTEVQRAARLQTTVLAALECTRLVEAQRDAAPPLAADATREVTLWIEIVRKIITDEVEFILLPTATAMPVASMPPAAVAGPDPCVCPATLAPTPIVPSAQPSPDPISVVKREHPVKGAYRIGSATDPDATYRLHGAKKSDLGYNVNILVSQNFVRDIQAETGSQPDAAVLADMLQSQRDQHDLIPAKVIYDLAAGYGKTRHLVAVASHHLTQLVAALPQAGRRSPGFGPEHFILSADDHSLTCPNGVTTIIGVRSSTGDGRDFHFLASHCAACPVWSLCRSQLLGSARMRQVFISDYRAEVSAARLYNQTDDYKTDMKLRFVVERTIAALVRHNGARRSRRCGLLLADFQAKMDATAFNLKRCVRLLSLREPCLKIPASA
jgi:Transposase domain (DUF772)/Transposase DDE domain